MLFWTLLASGQITMRKIDWWQMLAEKYVEQPIDLAVDQIASPQWRLRIQFQPDFGQSPSSATAWAPGSLARTNLL
jgi:hypothetical protein